MVAVMAAGWMSKAKTVPPGEVREARKRESWPFPAVASRVGSPGLRWSRRTA